jgi:hypothetical protein
MITATPVLSIPYPDDNLGYLSLPVSGDDGFPQAFLLDLNGAVYRLTFAVVFSDPSLVLSAGFAANFFDLPAPALGLFLNLTVEVEALPAPGRLLGVSRVVIGSPISIGSLRFVFSRIKIAQANLAGPGSFGSEVLGQVAVTNG